MTDPFYLSPEWRKARQHAMRRANHRCGRCGSGLRGQRCIVHHRIPRRAAPQLALVASNLEVLCVACHGHSHHHGGAVKEQEPIGMDGYAINSKWR